MISVRFCRWRPKCDRQCISMGEDRSVFQIGFRCEPSRASQWTVHSPLSGDCRAGSRPASISAFQGLIFSSTLESRLSVDLFHSFTSWRPPRVSDLDGVPSYPLSVCDGSTVRSSSSLAEATRREHPPRRLTRTGQFQYDMRSTQCGFEHRPRHHFSSAKPEIYERAHRSPFFLIGRFVLTMCQFVERSSPRH